MNLFYSLYEVSRDFRVLGKNNFAKGVTVRRIECYGKKRSMFFVIFVKYSTSVGLRIFIYLQETLISSLFSGNYDLTFPAKFIWHEAKRLESCWEKVVLS